MPDFAYLLLAATVVFFVVVLWLFPDDARGRREAGYARDVGARRHPSPAARRPARRARSPLAAEDPERARESTLVSLTGPGSALATDEDAELSFEDAIEALDDEAESDGVEDDTAEFSHGEGDVPTPLATSASTRISTTAQHEPSGAVDHAPRRAFPESIAIPVAMTVATPPVEPRPVIEKTPYATNSANTPVTWSPRPTTEEPPRWATQSWRATSSVVARVSAIELPGPDDPRRRGLFIAAGAGLVVALVIAARR